MHFRFHANYFFYLERFLKKSADNQFSSITKGSIYHIKHIYIQPFTTVVDWPEIWCLMEVSTMFYICRYCVFTWWGSISINWLLWQFKLNAIKISRCKLIQEPYIIDQPLTRHQIALLLRRTICNSANLLGITYLVYGSLQYTHSTDHLQDKNSWELWCLYYISQFPFPYWYLAICLGQNILTKFSI